MMSPYHIPDILSGFQAEHPEISLSIIPDDDISLLRQNLCDLIFVRKVDQDYPDVEFVQITSDTLAAILPPGSSPRKIRPFNRSPFGAEG